MAKQRNLRRGRVSESGRIYLVTTVTVERRPVFKDFACARTVAQALAYHGRARWCESLAWVIMPDHLHWLLCLRERGRLDQLMRSFKAYTARCLNAQLGSRGVAFWQAGYHDHAVRQEEDLQQLARYVVGNPLRAGLVMSIGDYPFWDAVWL